MHILIYIIFFNITHYNNKYLLICNNFAKLKYIHIDTRFILLRLGSLIFLLFTQEIIEKREETKSRARNVLAPFV